MVILQAWKSRSHYSRSCPDAGKLFLTAYLTFKRAFNTLTLNALQTYSMTHYMLNNRSEGLWLPGYPAWRE